MAISVFGTGRPMVPVNLSVSVRWRWPPARSPTGRSPRRSGSRRLQPALATASCTAMPPPRTGSGARSRACGTPRCSAQAVNSVFTAGKTWNLYLASSLTKPGMSRGLGSSTHWPPMRIDIHRAYRQREDVIQRQRGDGDRCLAGFQLRQRRAGYQASDCSMLAMMFRCSSVAPLLRPVVPPVYCRKATSRGRHRPASGASQPVRPATSRNLMALGSE